MKSCKLELGGLTPFFYASPAYQLWKDHRTKIAKDFSANCFFKADDILCHMLCPITNELPDIPAMVDGYQGAYDYQSALTWIEKNPEEPLPGSKLIVAKQDLKFDFAHINTIIERLYKLQDIVHEKIKDKIYAVLGVKPTSDEQTLKNFEQFYFITHLINDNGIASMEELFSRCIQTESFAYLHKIKFLCFTKIIRVRSNRAEEVQKIDGVINRLPRDTEKEERIHDRAKYVFTIDKTLLKRIKMTIDLPLVRFVKSFWYNLAPEFQLIREHIPNEEAKITNQYEY